jgi:dihydrodipicolinate synthase/N-acetylneuraminate lyase
MTLPYTRSEIKERSRTQWVGACNVTLPSFGLDFSSLNHNAIGHDVRLAAEHGFWGTLVASESGTTTEEYIEFLRVAAAAAPASFRIVAHLSFSTVAEMVAVAKVAEEVGAEAALLSYPPSFRPKSSADIVEFTRTIAQSTDLALIAFAVMTWGFRPLDVTGFPLEAIEEIAAIDTVAAIKYEAGGSAGMAAYTEVFDRVGHLAIVENPMEHYIPLLQQRFGVQWFGTSGYEALGNRVPQVIDHLVRGNPEEAMKIFWSCHPAREAKGAFHATFGGANLIHRVGWKYLGWLQGYNGGLLRMPQMRLVPAQMKGLRAGLEASGFVVPSTDDEFYVGRCAQ